MRRARPTRGVDTWAGCYHAVRPRTPLTPDSCLLTPSTLIMLLADGVRHDTLAAALDAGTLPALSRLREEGGLHPVSTVFPSVTGPAYAPFLTGRFPGPVGLPGLRWYDRAHTRCRRPPYCRSYLGGEMRHLDADLDPATPTLFELAPSRLSAMSMLGRGARRGDNLSRDPRLLLRVARTHVRGSVPGWLGIDRAVARRVRARIAQRRPAVSFVAMMAPDKAAHAAGHESEGVLDALHIVDELAAGLREDAERAGTWPRTHLWLVSDHGHSRVRTHDDVADALRASGVRTIAHPWTFARRPDAAVMVSGNAMTHIYLDPRRIERPWWPSSSARWEPLVVMLLARPSVDLVILPHGPNRAEVRARGRGAAIVERVGGCYAYRPIDGDPLGLGGPLVATDVECHDATMATDYPDSLAQIAHLAGSPRAGDIILSAAQDWDFRARHEPMPHASSHGALHREHMLVPLLVNRPITGTPRRTVDVMPSALCVLGLPVPKGLDGTAFV